MSAARAALLLLAACGTATMAPARPGSGAAGATDGAERPAPFPRSALDKPSFTATAAELRALAAAAPAGDWPVVILREEHDARFDDRGNLTERWRYVFVIRNEGGIADYRDRGGSWDPETASVPTIRARVIAPDGTISTLDANTITLEPNVTSDSGATSVRRSYDFDLPDLVVGSIVEEEITRVGDRPRVAADTLTRFTLGAFNAPTLTTRVTIAAPAARRAKQLVVGLPDDARVVHARTADRESWTYELGRVDPRPSSEENVPSDARVTPQIAFTTAPGWAEVARGYHALVEKPLGAAFPWPSGLARPRAPFTLDAIAALRAFVDDKVTRTDIAFPDSSLLPKTPNATLAAGTGDAIDRAALLAALLRAAGIPTDLVLVRRDTTADVPAELPSLAHFNHLLLRAHVGDREVWICPEAPYVAIGDLPADDRNRNALVIGPTTTALVRTPAFPPAFNTAREVRTFHLASIGPASVIEETTESGAFAASRRRWIANEDDAKITELLTTYVDDEYQGTRTAHHFRAPPDLAAPVVMSVAAADAFIAESYRDTITVTLRARDTLEKVPSELQSEPSEPRRAPYEWELPHAYEIENRLLVPDGFTFPSPLPADQTRALGTARIIERWRIDGRTLVVTFRFESGAARITPAQHLELTRALAALASGTDTTVELPSTVWALADAGKHEAALAEAQRLITAYPRASVHYQQRAFVYVNAGLGRVGQQMARAAIAVDPKDPEAHFMLAWTLERDSLGRFHGPDFDRTAAIAAYRKARELGPTHSGIAIDFADLLERGAGGVPFERGSDLPGAIAMWRIAADLDSGDATALRLATALFHAGQFDAAVPIVENLDITPEVTALHVAATAMLADAQAAARLAGQRNDQGAPLDDVIAAAIAHLRRARHYDRARELAALGSRAAAMNAQLPAFAMLRRIDPLPATSKDPEVAVRGFLEHLVDGGVTSRWLWDERTARETRDVFHDATLRGYIETQGPTVARDQLLSLADLSVSGGSAGPWRVELDAMGVRGVVYVALAGGMAKVIGAAPSRTPSLLALPGVGRHALRLLAANAVEPAAQLLAWVSADAVALPLQQVWSPSQRSRDAVALGAAVLAGSSDPARTAPILAKCAGATPVQRERCDLALSDVYFVNERWRELVAHTVAWSKRQPDAVLPLVTRAFAFGTLGRGAEARALLAPFATRGDGEVQLLRFRVAEAQSDYALTAQLGRYLTSHTASAWLANEVAWVGLVAGTDLPTALQDVNRAIGADVETADDNALNTRAAIHVELGDTGAARDDLRQAMINGHRAPPTDGDNYVLGRIAERLGQRPTALAFYRRIKRNGHPSSPFALAARRLAAMK